MISHRHQCIFIHIPKTGGTSIERALGHFDILKKGVQDHQLLSEIEPLDRISVCRYRVNRHILRRNVDYRPELSRNQYRRYFKFSIVRNPWARVYSWYRNTIRDVSHRNMPSIPVDCKFDYFVRTYLDHWMLQPQTNWLVNRSGRIDVDFIGKFESLSIDFSRISDKLGLDLELPHLLDSGKAKYQEAYDDDSISIVGAKYSEEIDLFGYKFL
ncbi:MAG: sulfotransferase family 2 domain-containing protein [Cyclobacteriaceae bacterium]